MRKLRNSFFIFVLALNVLFIGSVTPVQGQDELPPCDELGEAADPGVNCEDGNNGHGNNPDGSDPDNPGNGNGNNGNGNGNGNSSEEVLEQEEPAAPAEEEEVAPAPEEAPAEEEVAPAPEEAPAEEEEVAPAPEEAPAEEEEVAPAPEEAPAEEEEVAPEEEAAPLPPKLAPEVGGGEEEIPVAIEAQGEIDTSAAPGVTNSEYISVANLGGTGSGTATGTLELFTGGNTVAAQTIPLSIPENGSVTVPAASINTGSFAGRITADKAVAAAVMNTNNTSHLGDSYMGFSNPTTKSTIPLVFRGHADFFTTFHIQNASDSQNNIEIRAFLPGDAIPEATVVKQIAGNNTLTLAFADSGFDAFGIGSGAFGFVEIESTNGQNVVAIAENELSIGGKFQTAIVPGVTDAAAGTTLVHPLAYKAHADFNTGINVVNLTGTPSTLTVNYTVDPFFGGATSQATVALPANGLANLNWAATPAFPTPTFGSIEVTSNPAVNMVGIVNSNKTKNGDFAFASSAVNPTLATANSAAPVALQLTGGYNAGINILTLGGATSVDLTLVRSNTNPVESYTINSVVSGTAPVNFNLAAIRAQALGGFPNQDFVGAAFITINGGTGMAIINNDNPTGGLSTQTLTFNYN